MLHAGLAFAVEHQIVAFDGQTVFRADRAVQIGIFLQPVQVDDCAAAVADKVGVVGGIPVKTFLTVDHTHAANQTVFPEERQVAVHRSQTQIRLAGFQLLVDPFSGRVTFCAADHIQNCFAFFTVSDRAFYVYRLLNDTDSYLQQDNSTSRIICKEENQKFSKCSQI